MTNDDLVRDGVRRTVGRAVLRRLDRLVSEARDEERHKRQLAGYLAIGLLLFAVASAAALLLTYH